MIRTIVVGTDGSAHGQHAVTWTADLASQLGAKVVLVHVAPPVQPPIAAAGGYVMYVPQDVIDETRAALKEQVRGEFGAPLTAGELFLGSTSHALTRHRGVPVIVVPLAAEPLNPWSFMAGRALDAP